MIPSTTDVDLMSSMILRAILAPAPTTPLYMYSCFDEIPFSCHGVLPSKHPGLQESFYPRLVESLYNHMVRESVDHTLLLWHLERDLERLSQYINVSCYLLHSGLSEIASSFSQSVDWQLV